MKRAKITSVEQLKKLVEEGHSEYVINLNFGLASSKFITPSDVKGKDFEVFNLSDDSTQNLSVGELFDKNLTNIGEAINKGAFYMEEI